MRLRLRSPYLTRQRPRCLGLQSPVSPGLFGLKPAVDAILSAQPHFPAVTLLAPRSTCRVPAATLPLASASPVAGSCPGARPAPPGVSLASPPDIRSVPQRA
jgi:hypothetical protein